MRVLAHLSDLHFGRVDLEVVEDLIHRLEELRPWRVVISGDLTQRARESEFREARQFLDRLTVPALVVPGNHDMPLFGLRSRFLRPLERYQRMIHPELEPAIEDDEVAIVGANTAHPFSFSAGRLSRGQLERIRRQLASVGPGKLKVLVSHHPVSLFEPRLWEGVLAASLADAGLDLLLSGHLHQGRSHASASEVDPGRRSVLMIQAGTAISTRHRGEANSFNLLRLDRGSVQVTRFLRPVGIPRFIEQETRSFGLGPEGWAPRPIV